LNLPDLDQARSAVLNSLPSRESQRGYRHAIDEFITWYCSEPRLSFNKAIVTRYRIHLESRQLAPGTINGRLAAVSRLACEAADAGLLTPDLAAGIQRVTCARLCRDAGGELDQIQFLPGHVSVQWTERYPGCKPTPRLLVFNSHRRNNVRAS